jgi:long-subunit fatty acid transport protein
VIFEEGTYAELSFGFTSPTVEGEFGRGLPAPFPVASGDAADSFTTPVLAFKNDLNERISYALILEEPFGADVSYAEADALYPLAGSAATFDSVGLTLLGRYEFGNGFSVHGGPRFVRTSADLVLRSRNPATGGGFVYDGTFEGDSDVGFVAGAAYERPDIALRVALTYSSETTFDNESTFDLTYFGPAGPLASFPGEGRIEEFSLPQSVNLDFQTGIAPGTLLFGSVRWADWSETEINVRPAEGVPPVFPDVSGDINPVVSYPDDYFTYTIGVGRQITDRLSGAVSVIYEPGIVEDFDPADPESGGSNLSPADGQLALLLASSYQLTESLEVGGGIRFARLGDVSTRRIGAEFEDSTAVSLGLRVGYRF